MVSKRQPVNTSLELSSAEPWDTVKAQLLVKIDNALSPPLLNFDGYTTMFYIPRLLAKPGIPLTTDENYASLLLRVMGSSSKMPTVNITIEEKKSSANKENMVGQEPDPKGESGKQKKKVCS